MSSGHAGAALCYPRMLIVAHLASGLISRDVSLA